MPTNPFEPPKEVGAGTLPRPEAVVPMTSRPSTAAPILAVLAVVLPFALYVGGYFCLGEYDAELDDYDQAQYVWRNYQEQWVANMYKPAGQVESWLRGLPVQITCPDDGRL